MRKKLGQLIQKHAKSFYWASFFLSKECYLNCSYLYDFCRTVDDIVDSGTSLSEKKKQFYKFIEEFKNKNMSNVIIKNMWFVIQSTNINLTIINDFFEGIERDLVVKVNPMSKQELYTYSYQVAGTVGIMMSKVLNVENEQSFKGAIELGIAMQLTNIARDVQKDKLLNRAYIAHNFKTIKETILEADQFYNSSFDYFKYIPLRNRLSILVARRVYRQIGYEILKLGNIKRYNERKHIYVNCKKKLQQTLLAFLDFIIILFLKYPNSTNIEKDHVLYKHVTLHGKV